MWHEWDRRGTCIDYWSESEIEKEPLGRPRHRWIDNIKIDLLEKRFSAVDWVSLAQDKYRWRALMNAVMNLRVP
jgi:hypothetical protein